MSRIKGKIIKVTYTKNNYQDNSCQKWPSDIRLLNNNCIWNKTYGLRNKLWTCNFIFSHLSLKSEGKIYFHIYENLKLSSSWALVILWGCTMYRILVKREGHWGQKPLKYILLNTRKIESSNYWPFPKQLS